MITLEPNNHSSQTVQYRAKKDAAEQLVDWRTAVLLSTEVGDHSGFFSRKRRCCAPFCKGGDPKCTYDERVRN